ncbi:single-strand binding protein/Primosomal replication protein n (plasmid) [Pseudonocardia dioxanivorans CB1190]|uniref:Single-strand binding protein/Primosomal replication protein n n=1 Tax=Pseudonocardia dioxanivorans (strain ATCC 55486 / DSM 44775 / JCM 13855 / CB1190) TaxID=675635 RepID=F2L6K8_PSEUX|nr:single-stranded DNA-binding protein [Pseudonocardia dioxanivorans]AEA28902.1 single-strand binding protein/Primosomal replication protein n [Pseudonocardia dioxanivorans CB1190]
MNDQTYIGNIGKKPTFEFNEHTGKARLQFSLAVNKRYQDRESGEWRDGRTLWLNVVAFGPVAENASNLSSGDPVVVIGELVDNSFTVTDDDGQSREIPRTEVRAKIVTADTRKAAITVARQPRREHTGSTTAPEPAA